MSRSSFNPSRTYLPQLQLALQRLDQLLSQAVDVAEATYGQQVATNPYRGLQISLDEVEHLLTCEPAAPKLWTPQPFSETSSLQWLADTFSLSPFDLDILLLALAPELDLRYERLYAYLQDDVTRKRPTVDLALNLLCPDAATKLARRDRFSPDAPLIRHHLLHLVANLQQVELSQLSHYLKLDEQLLRFLLGQTGIDPRLQPFCQFINPPISRHQLFIEEETQQTLLALTQQLPLRLYFQGSSDLCINAAQALAQAVNTPLLLVKLDQILDQKKDIEEVLRLALREAQFQPAVLYLDGVEALGTEEKSFHFQQLLIILTQPENVHPGITILAGRKSWKPATTGQLKAIVFQFPIPDFAQRQAHWKVGLAEARIELDSQNLSALAARFRLTPEQITNAIALVCNTIKVKALKNNGKENTNNPEASINSNLADLFAAARVQSGHDLTILARKIQPKYSWKDIVLPANQMAQLHEICVQVKYQYLVWEKWGFEQKLSLNKGLSVMFSGPPGNGKTMAAEIIAQELQLDLYKIDLSQVVSKYIGETEKNLNSIFTAATDANAILLFDEADSLFGKRTEVKDAHDRYANLEISYLLQRMEEFEGLAILTTNLRSNMDDAFVRRLRFIIEFPFPNEEQRRQIWQGIFPTSTPRSPNINLDVLARNLEITGAEIRNIALGAAFLAASDRRQIESTHLLQAVRREYQKMGKILKDNLDERMLESRSSNRS